VDGNVITQGILPSLISPPTHRKGGIQVEGRYSDRSSPVRMAHKNRTVLGHLRAKSPPIG